MPIVLMMLLWSGVAAAFAYWLMFSWRPSCAMGAWVRTAALGFPAIAVTLAGWPLLALAGLWASVLAGYFLSRPGARPMASGIAAFAAAHAAYIGHFVWGLGLDPVPDLATWAAIAAVIALALSTEVWLIPATGQLRSAVRAYVALATLLAVCALLLGQNGALAKPGTMLFIASDLLLALELFVLAPGSRARGAAAFLIWPLYVAGQAGIQLAGL